MDLVIDLLKKDFIELRNHLKFIGKLKNDILATSINYEYSKSASKRKFDYSSIIISLYGLVENYVEKFCFQYSEKVQEIYPTYDLLETKLKDNHFSLSIELIKKITETKHLKFANINKENVINNLSNCITGQQNYKLNKEAFALNTGNLKHSKICDTIRNFNINLEDKLKNKLGINVQTENGFNLIDELVQRRNEIAHGNTENILDISEIFPYVDFVEKYLINIGFVLNDEIVQLRYQLKKKKCKLISNIKIFKGNILGIPNGKNLNLNIDDEILIEKSNNITMSSKIVDIRQFENEDVTIKLDHNIRNSFKFYS